MITFDKDKTASEKVADAEKRNTYKPGGTPAPKPKSKPTFKAGKNWLRVGVKTEW